MVRDEFPVVSFQHSVDIDTDMFARGVYTDEVAGSYGFAVELMAGRDVRIRR